MDRDELIEDVVTRVGGPTARSVVLVGPAGIGKSYTAAAVVDRIAEAGRPTLRIAAGNAQRHLPFGAVLHLLDRADPPTSSTLELTQRLRSLLHRDAEGRPLTVLVDDIDALDVQSAALVENALVHGDIIVLATHRSGDDDGDTEHHLSQAMLTHADELLVEPMTTEALVRLLDAWFGPGEHGSMLRLAHLSGGNPMLLREMARAARAQGVWAERGGSWYVGHLDFGEESLDRLVSAHLARLDGDGWELVRLLAVSGTLSRRVLVRLDHAALERLEHDGLLCGDPSWFTHPLYGEVLERVTTADEHRRLLSKLVNLIGPGDEVSDARLGRWLLEIGEPIDPGLARRGAAEAINGWQNDLARRLLESIPEPTANDLTELQWALANDGHTEAALAVGDRAVALATNDDERAASGLARSELLCFQLGRRAEGLEQLSALRDGLSDPVHVRRVDGALSLYAHVCGERRLATERRAAAIADMDGVDLPDHVRVNVLMAAGIVPAFRGRIDDARPVLDRGEALAASVGSTPRAVRFRLTAAMAEARSGRFDAARALVTPHLDSAAVIAGGPAHGAWLAIAGDLARQTGAVVEAERYFRESIRACEFVDDLAVIEHARAELGSLLAELGRRAEAESLLVDLPDSHRGDLRGEGSRARGLVRLAAPHESDEFAVGMASIMIDAGYDLWAPGILHEAARCRRAPRSARMLVELTEQVDGPLVQAYADHAVGTVEHDVATMLDAARGLRSAGALLSALDVDADVIDELKRARRAGEAARRLLAAQRLLDRLPDGGRLPVAQRLAAHAVSVESLTSRQREIVTMVLTGGSSRDVAERLYLSVRTVDNHLATVYRKLGVSGRAELADLFDDHDPG